MFAPAANNEQALLKRVANGDESAFSELFYRYQQQVGALVYRLTLSRTLTEEITQDVFLKLWTSRADLNGMDNLAAWLNTVAKNHALNCLRKLVNEKTQQKNWEKSGSVIADVMQQQQAFDESGYLREEQFQLINQAVEQLPPQQKKVFLLSRYRKLKYEEIATELNLSRETVKSYLKLATSSISRFVTSRLSQFLFFIGLLSA
ncbi:MAG: RNA polymerase sigma-70 factor [Chitinophagaceae bacterium]|nr:MAG: RNA polymerase sigma-70 factor [Chitinophagaceae bacterium]